MTDDERKRLATLQAAAALRGIGIESVESGGYYVWHGFHQKTVPSMRALIALLERMGVQT